MNANDMAARIEELEQEIENGWNTLMNDYNVDNKCEFTDEDTTVEQVTIRDGIQQLGEVAYQWRDDKDVREDRLECEIERLQAIIAKLPKCWRLVDGKLVQDCPVVPGMTAWVLDSIPMLNGPPVVEVVRVTVGHVLSATCSVVNQHGYGIGNRAVRALANTREAAEALAAEKGGG